ncbi:MAG: DegT/DnrJ/EryC1/StrS aminotransferase family protein [Dehalococcoidia bacterium]|nr:DegT/DnrJ/EryC1/StrS aminotransferase family protein [Dehalococcoidia bacterium]
MYRVPLFQADIGVQELERVGMVLRSGELQQGEVVAEFEDRFRHYMGTTYAVAVSSGTAALELSLLAGGIRGEDEVITPALAPTATTEAIVRCGAVPVYEDVDRCGLAMNPVCAEAAVTCWTRAVVPVHLFGCSCDTCMLLQDGCQRDNGTCGGDRFGPRGTGCFSFGRGAVMTTIAGGMLCTNEPCVACKAMALRDSPESVRYGVGEGRLPYRMTAMAAAIGLCQLERLRGYREIWRDNARLLTEGLGDMPGITVARELLCLPVGPHVTSQNIECIVEVVEGLRGRGRASNVGAVPIRIEVSCNLPCRTLASVPPNGSCLLAQSNSMVESLSA